MWGGKKKKEAELLKKKKNKIETDRKEKKGEEISPSIPSPLLFDVED